MENLSRCVDNLKNRLVRCHQDSYVLTEADTIRIFIMPLLRSVGWDTEDPKEVKSEYRTKTGDNPVDCALFLDERPSLFIEAKSLREDVNRRSLIAQTLSYASVSGVKWCVLTNGREWHVYNAHHQADASEKLFFSIDLMSSDLEDWKKLHLLSREAFKMNCLEREWQEQEYHSATEQAIQGLLDDHKIINVIRTRARNVNIPKDYIQNFLKQYRLAKVSEESYRVSEVITETSVGAQQGKISKHKLRTKAMFNADVLKKGMRLRILGHEEESVAFIHDENHVIFNDEVLSYNVWGCRVTGWSAIQIYMHAITDDGRTLDTLRKSM